MPRKPEPERLVRIDEAAALQYIDDNFNISGEARRMCAALFGFAGRHGEAARDLMLSVLDGIGFDESDLARMSGKGILHWEADPQDA